MDALTRAAVAGTSREKPPASGLPTDGLFESAAGKSPQRELLLRWYSGRLPCRWAPSRVRHRSSSTRAGRDGFGLLRESSGAIG
jgi:hypothetical protein